MRIRVSKKSLIWWLYIAGGVLLVAAVLVWCFMVKTNPERVFWSTIERGLTSRGVTVQSEGTTDGTTTKQIIRYSLGADNLSHSITTLSQQGTVVRNEMIGTPTADYSRYLSIQTDQKKADGTKVNFSKLLGKWTKSEGPTSQAFTQAVFGGSLPIGGMGIPVGNFKPEARAKLVQQIKTSKVYKIDFADVRKERVDGRLQYTYNATVTPEAYVGMMKRFSQSIGLHGLDQLDPADFRQQPAFELTIVVDAHAHNVLRISAADTGGSQIYSGHDIPVQASLPKDTMTPADLQKLLSEFQ